MSICSSPFFFEESAQYFRTFIPSYAAVNGGFVAVAFLKKVNHTAAGAGVLILCAVNHCGYAGVYDAAGTHGTGLKGYEHGAIIKPPVSHACAGLTDRLQLCVGGGIVGFFPAVAAFSDYLTVFVHYDTAHGDFPRLICLPGILQRHIHVVFSVHSVTSEKGRALPCLYLYNVEINVLT